MNTSRHLVLERERELAGFEETLSEIAVAGIYASIPGVGRTAGAMALERSGRASGPSTFVSLPADSTIDAALDRIADGLGTGSRRMALILDNREPFDESLMAAVMLERVAGNDGSRDPALRRFRQAVLRYDRGELHAPLERLEAVEPIFERAGAFVLATFTRALIARILMRLGRRRRALQMIAEAAAQCRHRDALGLEKLVGMAREDDPLAATWLEQPSPCAPDPVREALRGLLVAPRGKLDRHASLEAASAGASPDAAFDRALLGVVRALLARGRGRERLARKHLGAAIDDAAAAGADADLVPTLHQTWSAVLTASRAIDTSSIVIDARAGELRDGERPVPLGPTPVLARLLHAFGAAPAHQLTRDQIARAIWGSEYNPLRRESSVKSNIRRLRDLFQGTRLAIASDERGYRLVAPCAITFIALAPAADENRSSGNNG